MNPISQVWRGLGLAGRVAVALAVAIILVLVWWAVSEPGRRAQRAAEARAAQAFGQAQVQSAGEAAAIQDQAHNAADQSERLSRETADVLHHAPGAEQRLDPGLNRALHDRLCLRAAYRDRPECVQQPGGPKP